MKKICLGFFICGATLATAQNKDYIIGMNGLGSLKLGMNEADIEKLVNQEIVLDNYLDTINNFYLDTAILKYKGITVQLEFNRSYDASNKILMRLIGIRASSPLCKTATGIGAGTDRLKIIKDYESYHIKIQPGFANYYQTETGKGKSTVSVLDDAVGTMNGSDEYTLVFYLMNNKVQSFELKAYLGYNGE